MRIAVNAAALRGAGGLSVGLNFFSAFKKNPRGHTIDAFVPPESSYENLASDNLVIHQIPGSLDKLWIRPYLDKYWLLKRMEEADVVFSMGNIALPTRKKQLVLFMWPYATYPDSEVWGLMKWTEVVAKKVRREIFKRRLKHADIVAPQTETSARRLRKYYPSIREISVVPTAVSAVGVGGRSRPPIKSELVKDKRKKLLCLTRYRYHKNLEVLVPLAEVIKKGGGEFVIVITIAKDQHSKAARLLAELQRKNLGDTVQNIGPVPIAEVPALYESVDGLLLPTLLESFSGTYADAMGFGKPVFTSDRDFAHDVCGDAAFYFDPHSPENIYQVLKDAFSSTNAIVKATEKGYARIRKFPDWDDVARQYIDLLEGLVDRR